MSQYVAILHKLGHRSLRRQETTYSLGKLWDIVIHNFRVGFVG